MRPRYFAFLFIALSIIVLSLSSCGTKSQAYGEEDEIYIVADSAEYFQLEPTLLQVFSKVIYTPQPENLFELKRKSFEEFGKTRNKKNIILIAPLNSNSETSKFIGSILDSTVLSMVQSGKEFYFNKYDLWAKEQLVMIITAPTIDDLNKDLLSEHENLLYHFQKMSNNRLSQSLYKPQYEKKDIQAKLLNKYGWIIYVQADFLLAKENPEDNFVWLRRAPGSDMERWIFVHWIEKGSPEFLNPDSIQTERNKLTEKYYRSYDDSAYVEIADDYKTTGEVNFNGRYAIMTQGLWRMNDKSMGGPFINYTFYDEKSQRIYMVDGSIYAPKYQKKKLIQQVDVMLQSFMTKAELSTDRIEELTDALE